MQSKFHNQLINESSPYLLQHAYNPVNWYPWGEEALTKSKTEDKPILLSIGYSACHWCHVMERESFENEEIAALMNESFINIKVDREERPDLDSIYMNAVQMMSGRGGWPMTVFLTPNQVPFFGGTYFPPEDRHGMPGFPRVLISIAEIFNSRREEMEHNAQELLSELQKIDQLHAIDGEFNSEFIEQVIKRLISRFDFTNGGFSPAPKFPNSMSLTFLLKYWAKTKSEKILNMVEFSLEKMAFGGMYDQLGGGFHRYSTDDKWLVPHFEKMLYDNALLSWLYLDAYLITKKNLYKEVVEGVLDYVVREMTSPEGGFYSAQDADSEGEEGKFFVWKKSEIEKLLGSDNANLFCHFYDITDEGNFESSNILHISDSISTIGKLKNVSEEVLDSVLKNGRKILFETRERRIRPTRDEKQITAWNGLMLTSFARAARTFERKDYLEVAIKNAEFIKTNLYINGRLLRIHSAGKSKLNGYLEDYTFYANGLLSLYEATFDSSWLKLAKELMDIVIEQFSDEKNGGFFFTSKDHEKLISRTKDLQDNAIPSGNSVAVEVLLRLSAFTGKTHYRLVAEKILLSLHSLMSHVPSGFGYLLCSLDFYMSAHKEIVLVGSPDEINFKNLLKTIYQSYLPNSILVSGVAEDEKELIPLLGNKFTQGEKAVAYVCENYTCGLPIITSEDLLTQLQNI